MTRSTSSLHRHLLTRSDLAHLQVPAGDVLAWLADGAIEQVGEIAAPDDPVFMVPSAELRRMLAPRLAEIGKQTVVLTPMRVRSFLMRALLGHGAMDGPAAAPDPTTVPAGDDLALVAALQTTAAEIEADVEVMLRLAAEEAELEQHAADAETADPLANGTADTGAPEPPAAPSEPDAAPPSDPTDEPEADDECFELDDLTRALDDLLPDPAATSATASADTPDTPEPPAPVATADAPEPADHEPAPTEPTMTAEAATTPDSERTDEVVPDPGEPAPARLPTGAEVAAVLDLFETNAATRPPAPPESIAETPPPTTDRAPMADAVLDSTTAPDAAGVTAIAAATNPTRDEGAAEPLPVASHALARVESFLAQLKETLVELAQRPSPTAPPTPPPPAPTLDVAPIVQALQQGFERSNQQAEVAQKAIATLGEHVAALGPGLQAIAARPAAAPTPVPAATPQERPVAEFVVTRTSRAPVVMLALSAMVVAWSVMFWVKTGSMKLALGTLVGGNLVACSLLAFGRQR